MKRSTKVKIIIFFIVFFLCFVDLRPLFRQNEPAPVAPQIDETRKSYKVGSCYNMKDDLCYFIIFLDDNESSWNEAEKENFTENKFIYSMNYLSSKANDYSVTLCTKYSSYPADENAKMIYNGILESDVVENGSQTDILNQVAESMSFASPEEMNSALKNQLNVGQIAYLLAVNKEGRSYKYAYTSPQSEKIEFVVFFDDSIAKGGTCCSTIAHEILHLFGAEDYYDPYGKLPQREKMANELYPNDIMLISPSDVNKAEIGAYTAYSVGWTDIIPAECNTENWWK